MRIYDRREPPMIRSTGMFNESCGSILIKSEIVKPELSREVKDDDDVGVNG